MDDRSVLASVVILASGAFIGGAAAYLGSLMLGRRMALVAGPLGHLTLPGVALALTFGFDMSLAAFPFVVLGVLVIWALEARTRLPMESLTALVFATGVAIAFLFLPMEQAETALVGDIARTSIRDGIVSVLVCIGVVVVVRWCYPKLVLINISEDLALSEGIAVRRYNFIYLMLIAIVVALGVKMVGGLLTAALVAIPPAAARNVGRNLHQYAWGATAVGVVAAIVGILLHFALGYPAGPMVVASSAVFFLMTLPLARKA
ncbi:MAG: metal ABC transporter permease [Pseudomonadales bacterium]|nr:metal ABC transporter permease [Pseudomonadales bacterium]